MNSLIPTPPASIMPLVDPFGFGRAACDYWRDTLERSVLFMDVMRQRGNQYLEHIEKTKPNVLGFDAEVLMDGRTFARPVNYELLRIQPPDGVETDLQMRPFVVVDPRAGHGPGIGGFKPDSEIGVALRAGHPCYFIGFLPYPVPGQTVEDVVEAEIAFLRHVVERHPETSEKPMVVGNCQAGWQVMMAASLEPELFGPILIAGAPLSYWAGERGKAPMRYTGGLTGGSWMTALFSDLGNGLFDGAWLVQNFERLNPANTWWTKQYQLYAEIDTEADRYLEFERWWGGHVVLGGDEIQYIVDNLFVGNRLSTAQLVTSDGRRIDLRNVRSPVVVFCSKGDDITPPPQALGWIRDLYEGVEDVMANEQTIVYCVHDTTGHLGIFVSGSVSRKEHAEFTANMDYIDVLPPGLYETTVSTAAEREDAELIERDYLLEFTPRTIEELDKDVQHRPEDDTRFAAVARISEINLGFYRYFMQPWVQAMATPESAKWMRRMHPNRLGYRLLSDRNPLMTAIPVMADKIRADRHPVHEDNVFRAVEGIFSDQITRSLNAWRRRMKQSMGLMVVYFTTRRTYTELEHHTIVFGETFREILDAIFDHHALVDDLSLYLHRPGATDPDMAPEDGDAFYVLAPVPNLKGGHDWATIEPQLTQRIFATLAERVMPDLFEQLDASHAISPRYFHEALSSPFGSGFSIAPTLTQSAGLRFHNRSPHFNNLYFVGAGTHPGAGVPGVVSSAAVVNRLVKQQHGVAHHASDAPLSS